jgi:hypothetical protein
MRDAQAHDVFGRAPLDAFPGEADLALGLHHRAHRAQRGRLAGAVGAEERGNAPLLEREVEAVEHAGVPVGGAQVLDLKQCQGRPA